MTRARRNENSRSCASGCANSKPRPITASASRRSSGKPTGYYTAYYATTGFMLGGVAAMSSLLFNIVGALLFGKHPLELIRVYLTFPLGEQALDYDAVDNGLILAIGCCLYLATGMLYGILFQIVLTRFTADSSLAVPVRRGQPAGAGRLAGELLRHPVLAAAAVVRRPLDRRPDSLVGRRR